MKRFTLLLFIALITGSVFGQQATYPFQVIKSGQGTQSLLFIPGFSCSGAVWDETKVSFEKDYTCYTLTMAGFAGATAQPNISFKNWEGGIATFIKENQLGKPIVIGHSMGGGLALALASDYPELIQKIVVVDALPCLSALFDPNFKSKDKPDCGAMLQQITTAKDEDFLQMQKMSMKRLLADQSKQELVVGWSMKSDRTTFASMYCDFSNTDLRESIQTIKCPTLVLLESNFVSFKPAIEAQYKNLKAGQLAYATKGLHFIMYDDKDWYMNQLTSFIKAP